MSGKKRVESIKFFQGIHIHMAEVDDEQLDAELEKGYADMLEGRIKSAREVFDTIRKGYEIGK